MKKLIDLEEYPIAPVLKILLEDKTTKKNIIWATHTYSICGYGYTDKDQIQPSLITGFRAGIIQPRIHKSREEQIYRTRKKAEVFTPVWICNLMNNACDEEWFGQKDIFNIQKEDNRYLTTETPLKFLEPKKWTDYVDSKRLEITCGEAPFLASRYDASTGELIPVKNRIGILDRKLRIVNENTDTEEEWLKWTIRAFQSVYGYEYQGDSLLIARINLLYTFYENMIYKWKRKATIEELKQIAKIIAWNLWQMDGLTNSVPSGAIEEAYQLTFFDMLGMQEIQKVNARCKIYDWRAKRSLYFYEIKGGK